MFYFIFYFILYSISYSILYSISWKYLLLFCIEYHVSRYLFLILSCLVIFLVFCVYLIRFFHVYFKLRLYCTTITDYNPCLFFITSSVHNTRTNGMECTVESRVCHNYSIHYFNSAESEVGVWTIFNNLLEDAICCFILSIALLLQYFLWKLMMVIDSLASQ